MVDQTLRSLDAWFLEPTQDNLRPMLLSKLAVIELCGWIEGELDRIIYAAEAGCILDQRWAKNNVVDRNHGFDYSKHFRPMLCKVVGEASVRRIETEMEARHPGEVDDLTNALATLWKRRCSYAHADVANNVATQQRFDAPSWAIGEHQRVSAIIARLEAIIMAKVATL